MTSTILIVDDDLNTVKKTFGEPLEEDYGWKVDYAGGYTEALDYLSQSQPDVVLLDRRMPDPHTKLPRDGVGDELLEKIVFKWPGICPIMLTNNSDLQSAKMDTLRGAFEYFDKNVPNEVLDRACRAGMAFRTIERESMRFLEMEKVEDMVAHARRVLTNLWASQAHSDASAPTREFELEYLRVAPGQSFLELSRAADATEVEENQSQLGFVTPDPMMERVVASGLWDVSRNPADGLSLKTARCRACIPVFDERRKNGERTICGLLWFESSEPDAIDVDRARMLRHLATFIGYGLIKSKKMYDKGADASAHAQDWFSKTIARSLCYPLQTAQTELELLSSEMAKADSQTSAAQRLRTLSKSLEQAAQYSVELRQRWTAVSADKTLVDLGNVVNLSVDAIETAAKAQNITISRDVSPRLPLLMLDPVQMRHAVTCILENAIDAIKEKRIRKPEFEGKIVVKVDADPTGKHDVLLSIVDNGCGIVPNDVPKVFDRYFTTKDRVLRDGHSSMGLSHVKQLIEDAFHGTIEAARTPRGGAEFTILLPVNPPGDRQD